MDLKSFFEYFSTMEGVEWWQFWHPGSGARGGMMLGLVFWAIYKLLT